MRDECHLWLTEVKHGKGGIQTYNLFLLTAMAEIFPQIRMKVYVKNDTKNPDIGGKKTNIQYHCFGGWPFFLRTVAFIISTFVSGLWNRPGLVIVTHLNYSAISLVLKILTKVPVVISAHGIEAWNINSILIRTALMECNVIFSVSQLTKDRLVQKLGLAADKVKILPPTFDSDRFRPGQKPRKLVSQLGLTDDQPVILTVGRLSEGYKGFDQLLRAIPRIKERIPNIHYVIVGTGHDGGRIKKIIEELGLKNNVTLQKNVSDDELNDYFNLSDVFVMPSRGEGFGIVFLEALACGKPVVAGDQDGSQEALLHGELGVMVNSDNIDEIAKAVIQILQGVYPNPILYQPTALRKRIIESYGYQSFKEKLTENLKFVRQSLNKQSTSAANQFRPVETTQA